MDRLAQRLDRRREDAATKQGAHARKHQGADEPMNAIATPTITMTAMNAVSLANRHVETVGGSIIVLELTNSGSGPEWAEQFPSIPRDPVDLLETTTFLRIEGDADARAAFATLIDDCIEHGSDMAIDGTITLVNRWCEIVWHLGASTRPTFEDRMWRTDDIPSRI